MFKNAIVYRIAKTWAPDLQAAQDAAAKTPFLPCDATQERSCGWVPPRGEEHGLLIESIGGQWMMRFFVEQKILPAEVLNRRVEEKAEAIEKAEGRKPGKMERRELKDEAKLDLLPMAFTKRAAMWVWIDPANGTLVLDATSQSRADEVVTLLVEALPGFALALLDTKTSPQAAMSNWLVTQEAPTGFTVDRECELKAADESKAVVKYGRHPLDIDQVREHIEHGKLPTKLAMTWDDRVSFVLTEGLQIKKIELLDAVMGGQSQDDGGFDADVTIATAELSRLIVDLAEALGGEERAALETIEGIPEPLRITITPKAATPPANSNEPDPLYREAVTMVLQENKASISYVQRKLLIGYNRAARLLEDMERAGLVGAMDSVGQRQVIGAA